MLLRDAVVAQVRTYYGTGDRTLVAGDRRSTYVTGGLRPVSMERQLAAARRVERGLKGIPGVKLGGRAAFYANGNDTARADLIRVEMVAFPLLLLLALWIFRGLVAALLPLLVGATTVAGTVGALRVATSFTDVSVYALNIVSMLGLGLAVDYSLLVLTRYREEALRAGYGREALGRALARTGPTVVFSSLTVAAAAAALLVFPQTFLRSIAMGAIFVALLAGAAAVSVLPAALAALGPRLDALTPGRWRLAARRAARPATTGFWHRFARLVMRAPLRVAVTAAFLLLALAVPSIHLATTAVDSSVVPKSSPDRKVAEALARDGRNAPVVVAAEPPSATGGPAMRALAARVQRLPDAASVTVPRVLRRSPRGTELWRMDVMPGERALSSQSQELVRAIRAVHVPYRVLVGGETAGLVDLKDSLGGRLPLALVLLLALTCVPIFLATGSLVLPLKTLLMNALTVAATFGILVFVFQRGRFEGLLGYTSSGALEASVLILTFAVSFGLATDYGMFLLGRIKEERERGAGEREAVALGLERTGRVVTGAAMLLCVALGSLVAARHALVKEFGVGTALAVAIDATLVRALLVPSLMCLLGRFNWWAPRSMRALIPAAKRRALPLGSPAHRGPSAKYLAPTRYCDPGHPAIVAALGEILNGREDERQAAVKLFRFVRDQVRYEFGPWGAAASDTLALRAGTCTNKANLLVALLRAAGIPAAYGVMRVDAQRYFGPIGPQFLTQQASPDSTHVYSAAHLGGRWVRCDPSTDRQLAALTSHWCQQTRLVVWDGRRDMLDFLDPAHVHADLGLEANIDGLLAKPTRKPELPARYNDYLAFVRRNPPFASPEELIDAYGEAMRSRKQPAETSTADMPA